MAASAELVRDFVLQVEKTLTARRLYASHTPPYKEASEKLFEKCRLAAADDGFTLGFGPHDLFFERQSLLNKPKREESFFFPLYRDGLRELSFCEEPREADMEALLVVLESSTRRTSAYEDTVTLLWRSDMNTIIHNAIDGIGDVEEGENATPGSPGTDFRGMIADLNEKIQNPAPPSTGQSYAFIVDADIRVGIHDLHYDASTVHRKFEENPSILRLDESQAGVLRQQVAGDREGELLERFVDILLILFLDPSKPATMLAPIFERMIDGYFGANDYTRLLSLLTRLRAVASTAPLPDDRAAAADVMRKFLTPERIRSSFPVVQQGVVTLKQAAQLWSFAGGEALWDYLVELWAQLSEGDLRNRVSTLLRNLLGANPELLRRTLARKDVAALRCALTLIDERTEKVYANELIALTRHEDESIRLKGLAAAGRLGGPAGLDVLCLAMERDPSKSVRLFAFRVISTSSLPGIGARLRSIVEDASFESRPVWEREKYVRLLGTILGDEVLPLFETWVPKKKWMWQPKDAEIAELAFRGMAASGDEGYEKLGILAQSGGKMGELAKKIYDATAKGEFGEGTMMRAMPGMGGPKRSEESS